MGEDIRDLQSDRAGSDRVPNRRRIFIADDNEIKYHLMDLIQGKDGSIYFAGPSFEDTQ